MKLKKILKPILIIGLIIMAATAQEQAEKIIGVEEIYGTWESLDDPFLVTITYASDSTFSGNINQNGNIVWEL